MVYRGLVRMGAGKAIKGKVSCPEPVLSPASRIKCAYSRTVIDRYGGGTRWIPLAVLEAKAPFSIGREKVTDATFEISKFNLYKGYAEGAPKGVVRRAKGMFSKFLTRVATSEALRGFTVLRNYIADDAGEVHEGDVIPATVIKSILSHPGTEEVKSNLSRPLRIREYVLGEGAPAILLGIQGAEPLVSDMDEESSRTVLRERSFLGVVAGGSFIAVGILAALLMVI